MTEQIEQHEHFFSVGDRVVLLRRDYKNVFKRMSYNDVIEKTPVYLVIEVIDKNNFKVKPLHRGI